jgi:vesicular inhibitory amino acid transporter
MEKKEQFNQVVDVTYFITFFIYTSMSVAGYLMFGSGTLQEITLNLGEGVLSHLATVMTVITPLAKFALTLTPSKSLSSLRIY